MKVALVYDRVNKFGGAERVLLALHEIFPKAPLYTSVYDKNLAPWADAFEVRTSFLQKLPLPKNAHEYYPFLMGPAFETFNFDEFDLVISVTHEFAKAVITKPGTLHICYCLTPTSYLWEPEYSQYFYGRNTFRKLTRPLVKYLRWYDKIVAQRPDEYISISETVRKRVKHIYGRVSKVIYPPVEFARVPLTKLDSYYLVVSRLAPQKRLDVAIRAFNKLGLPLKIVGIGKEEKRLKVMAKANIEFLGYLTDEQLARYYESCRAVVIPGEEDFNLVAVEAQSFGKPVIAYGKGGVAEIVLERKTGWFFGRPTADCLVSKIWETENIEVSKEDCIQNARRFSKERFKKEFLEYVRNLKKNN